MLIRRNGIPLCSLLVGLMAANIAINETKAETSTQLEDCEQTFRAVAQMFESFCGNEYRPGGFCYQNVATLTKAMDSLGADTKAARVLFIYPNNLSNHLHPQMVQDVRDSKWGFHMVVEYHGRILDPDFDQPPGLYPIATYFRKMFGTGNIDFNNIKVREIEPERYRSILKERGSMNFHYHMNEREDLHPSESLSAYVARKNPDHEVIQSNSIPPERERYPVEAAQFHARIKELNTTLVSTGLGRHVSFEVAVERATYMKVTGEIEYVGPTSVQIKTEAASVEFPLALIKPGSVRPMEPTKLSSPTH